MCLYLKEENKKPCIANEDIVCYKVVYKSAGQYRSPYTSTLYKLNSTMNDSVRIIKRKKPYTFNGKSVWSISAGGFHVYPTLNEAKTHIFNEYEILKAKDKAGRNFVILKCIIPKDTKYYIGTFSGMKSYCSKSLKIIDEVNE